MTCPHCLSTSTRKRKHRTSLGYETFSCQACRRRFNERTGTSFNDLQFSYRHCSARCSLVSALQARLPRRG